MLLYRLWAVYDCLNHLGPVAWPVERCASGEYYPTETVDMPDICPLPLSVHDSQAAANRAVALIVFDCSGSA